METNVNYTLVGAFVIALTAVIILAIIWLSSGLTLEYYTTYQVNMKESVSGLNLDSPVEYNGVNVGTVHSMMIDPKNPQLVELLLSIKSDTPVTKGTTATLNVKGLTGVAFIALQDKGKDTAPLVAGPDEPYPLIKTAPSFLLRMDAEITKLNETLTTVSLAFKSLFDDENLRAFKSTLVNFQNITATMAGSRQAWGSSLTQTLPTANDAVANFDKMSSNLSDLSKEIKQNPSILIRGKTEPALGPGEQ